MVLLSIKNILKGVVDTYVYYTTRRHINNVVIISSVELEFILCNKELTTSSVAL